MGTKPEVPPKEYEVERIQEFTKDDDGVSWYFVKWLGYPSSENTWEPLSNLGNCRKIIRKFHKQEKREKLNRQEFKRKRELSGEAIHSVPNKKPKTVGLERAISPVDLSNQRRNVQRALRRWRAQLNKVCTDNAVILVENRVDLEGPPKDFTYINDYKPGPGIVIPTDPLVGCDCEDCSSESNCCAQKSGAPFAYSKFGRIKVPPGKPVYECNIRCKCGPKCPNRVVQYGRQVDVAIFRTSNGCGWGVKTLKSIKKNAFVMEYVGEVITNEEAERRGQIYDANGRTYLFDLDYNDGDCPFTVDAGRYGNVSHFVNHSCDPNLVVYGVWVNTLDPRLPRIALFASRDIKEGEELSFDYQMTGELNTSGSASKLQPIRCRCGAKNCRDFLF
ncbi:histone-lysine N-methyltransferase SUV39H2-like [Acanthaster planci]|uniref:Histone-lysine N-methyltransferase n=1 Tax=Acanthaster planci TaxID=133434 RepID=A0A8B7Z3J7_ACAPL|nr:histone-lysine N-methyltransferase SUV39H2-like [Acanthaster planci]